MKCDYQKLMERITVPDGLQTDVLRAARKEAPSPRHLAERRKRPLLRAAVCAVCALALVLGSVRLAPRPETGKDGNSAALPVVTYAFGLTAYAADLGETIRPNANGGLALLSSTGIWNPRQGDFTGCLFQVTGENLQKVTLSVDRGGLYRSETRTGLTEEAIQAIWKEEEDGKLVCNVYGTEEDAPENAEIMTALGDHVTVEYDPAVSYGFWVPPEELPEETDDLRQDMWNGIDVFDGAHLTVEVTFADSKTQSRVYTLSTGRLRLDRYENGTWSVLPQLAGDEETFVYGIYAASEAESRWLRWPVDGSSTVSLSYPFGACQGEHTHEGIDIPAEQGNAVLAAADGTVRETGFDPMLGNYLILDHGGGLTTCYAACGSVDAARGDTVQAGAKIASVGSTGVSTGAHLHFEVRQDGRAQEPVAYFTSEVRQTLRMGE